MRKILSAGTARGRSGASRLLMVGLCVLLGLVSGCGSGAVRGPDSGDGGSSGQGADGGEENGGGSDGNGSGGDGSNGGENYGFRLPIGDDSTDPTSTAYLALAAGQCGEAEQVLKDRGNLDVLFQIGIDVCNGDITAARTKLAGYRWSGGEGWQRCELYRVSASVVYQRPKSTFTSCPPIPQTQTPQPESPDDGGSIPSESPSTSVSGAPPVEPPAEPPAEPSAGAVE